MKIALRHTLMLALLFIASAFGTLRAADPTAPSFIGTWQGTLEAGPYKLRIVFEIKAADGGGLRGTMDSPDQRAYGLKLDTVKQQDGNVTAEINMIGGAYDGTFSADGKEIVGDWTQGGQRFPLSLKRGDKIAPAKLSREPMPSPAEALRNVHHPVFVFAGSLDRQTARDQSFCDRVERHTSTQPHG